MKTTLIFTFTTGWLPAYPRGVFADLGDSQVIPVMSGLCVTSVMPTNGEDSGVEALPTFPLTSFPLCHNVGADQGQIISTSALWFKITKQKNMTENSRGTANGWYYLHRITHHTTTGKEQPRRGTSSVKSQGWVWVGTSGVQQDPWVLIELRPAP